MTTPQLPARDTVGQDLAVGDRIVYLHPDLERGRNVWAKGTIQLIHGTQLCAQAETLRIVNGEESGGGGGGAPARHVRFGCVVRLPQEAGR